MKDIGLKLKEKREENGVSVDEAAEDLKMRPIQIISLEEGRKEDFSDVNTLKFFIRDYAKYLGLDGEKLVDEFNEFLFDFTSKIPSEVIEEAKQKREKEKKEFSSPYTKKEGHNKTYIICIGVCVLVLLVFIITYFVVSGVRNNDFKDDNVTYVIRR
ncbi:MAG: helix-turn-helix domain-containing protein [Clostridium sp.]|nr:helix-turn-helix domain-containing protein [Clostridium sp.]